MLSEKAEDPLFLRNVKTSLREHLTNYMSSHAAESDPNPSATLMTLLEQDLPRD